MSMKLIRLAGLTPVLFLVFLQLPVLAADGPGAAPAAAVQGQAAGSPSPQRAMPDRTVSLGDAVLKALKANPGINIQQERVVQGEGLLQSASGQFDWVGKTSVSAGSTRLPLTDKQMQDWETAKTANDLAGKEAPADYTRADARTYSVGATKQFRTGVSVAPTLSTEDKDNNSDTWNAQNRSDIRIELTVPLLRGLGAQYTGANELATSAQLTSTRFLSKHNIARTIYETALNYWNCLASKLSFELTADTQARSDQLLTLVEKLVRAGSLEPAVLNQARAKLFSSKVDVQDGELSLYRSRQALALAMGYRPQELAAAPDPGGNFPAVADGSHLEKTDAQDYIRLALKQRGDLLAARSDSSAAAILLAKAENDTKPKLDLGLRVGYGGYDETRTDERYIRSLSSRAAGPNTFASLSLELPIANNTAKGNVVYRKSLLKETELNLAGIENQIASQVLIARNALRTAISEYQLAEQSESAYGKAVEFENRKYLAGTSTLTALIDIEDRYFKARVAKIEVLRKYSVALAEFRYVTGTLLNAQETDLRFSMERLVELPSLN
jgi:outer membrane protein TolC